MVPLTDKQIKDLQRRLRKAVCGSCPAWLASQAEDIAQEGLIRVVDNLQKKGDTDRRLPASYINKVAYHAIVDAIRRQQRKNEVFSEEPEITMPDTAQQDPEQASILKGIKKGFLACLEKTVPPRRMAAVLHLQGHSIPEISKLMDWTQTKSTNLVFRGIKDIRRCLENKGIKP